MIVDRNPNVREYLKRELRMDGRDVRLAENCREVFKMINEKIKFDLIIIDPDLPDAGEKSLLRMWKRLPRQTSVVIHSQSTFGLVNTGILSKAVFIEKDGNSIELLKNVLKCQPAAKQAL